MIDEVEIFVLLGGERGVPEYLGEAYDSVQGSADFVAHGGEETGLGEPGGLGDVLGLAKLVFGSLAAGDVAEDEDAGAGPAGFVREDGEQGRLEHERADAQLGALVGGAGDDGDEAGPVREFVDGGPTQ